MSEETSGSFTSRLFRKASANLAPAVTVQVADSPLSTRNSSSSPLSHITDNLAILPTTPTAAPAAAPAEAK